MRFPTPIVNALCAAAAVALLAACSSNGMQSPAGIGSVQHSSVVHQNHYTVVSAIPKGFVGVKNPHILRIGAGHDTFVKGGVYVGQFSATAINLYGLPNKHNKAPRCTDGPSSAPNGLGYDASTRTMWDPDGGSRSLIPFSANCSGEGSPIAESNGQPSDIAVDGNTVYVADNSLDTIDIYVSGSYTGALSNSSCLGGGFGDAVDQHNVFQACTAGQIIEYAGGTGPGVLLSLTGIGAPIGMSFDNAHNMVETDLSTGINVYAPPYSGSPIASAPTVGSSTYNQVNAANTALYVGDYGNGTADVYAYPSLSYEYSISNGLSAANTVEGIAVDSQGHQATP